jgi:acyl carrier protein
LIRNESYPNIGERVKVIMIDTLDLPVTAERLSDDTPLYSPLVQLDSLHLLQLIVALEEEFGGEIDDEDVMNADLENVGNLIDLVQSKLGHRRGV